MKKYEKEQSRNQNEILEGFNPNVYRSLSLLFIVLTIVNLAAIIYAFARTGYGLWHAEDALSCIAKIDGSFDDINQSILKIQLHPEDQQNVSACVDNILSYHQDIVDTTQKFRAINLSHVDSALPGKFKSTMTKADRYYDAIASNLNNVKIGIAETSVLHNYEIENLREDATVSLHKLFIESDEATYQFFCRVGQRFLLVILFLVLTMSAGLYAISRIKKHDMAFAMELQSSKQKTANIRQKAVEIAYTNVVTNLKNRYAMLEELDERMKNEDISLVLYDFNNFKSINEQFGRDYADDFVAYMSKKLIKTFGDQVEVFSTETDEFCVVFDKEMPKSKTVGMAQKIKSLLSQPVQVRSAAIQLTVAGCLCHCPVNAYKSASKLFVAVDQSIRQTKMLCAEQGVSLLAPLG